MNFQKGDFVTRKSYNNDTIFKILNILNFIIQDLALTLTYTSAGIVTFGGTLVLGLIYVMFKKIDDRIETEYEKLDFLWL